MVENDLIERGILIFSKINENQISDVIFNFLNRNINLFINKINKKELEGGTCLNEEKKKLMEKAKKRWPINALFKSRNR